MLSVERPCQRGGKEDGGNTAGIGRWKRRACADGDSGGPQRRSAAVVRRSLQGEGGRASHAVVALQGRRCANSQRQMLEAKLAETGVSGHKLVMKLYKRRPNESTVRFQRLVFRRPSSWVTVPWTS